MSDLTLPRPTRKTPAHSKPAIPVKAKADQRYDRHAEARRAKLERLYSYLVDVFQREGRVPTIRDICNDLNVSSTSVAYYNLNLLAETGLIELTPLKCPTTVLVEYVYRDLSRAKPLGNGLHVLRWLDDGDYRYRLAHWDGQGWGGLDAEATANLSRASFKRP